MEEGKKLQLWGNAANILLKLKGISYDKIIKINCTEIIIALSEMTVRIWGRYTLF